MTKDQYLRMTGRTRRICRRLPLGERFLQMPVLLLAALYLTELARLLLGRDPRFLKTALVPACCFLAATVLRRLINRPRPYDRFGAPPVGRYSPGKGRSLPSRHTASAAAIALALCAVWPSLPARAAVLLLGALIAFLRVAAGQHYPGDVLSALLLSGILSAAGYILL